MPPRPPQQTSCQDAQRALPQPAATFASLSHPTARQEATAAQRRRLWWACSRQEGAGLGEAERGVARVRSPLWLPVVPEVPRTPQPRRDQPSHCAARLLAGPLSGNRRAGDPGLQASQPLSLEASARWPLQPMKQTRPMPRLYPRRGQGLGGLQGEDRQKGALRGRQDWLAPGKEEEGSPYQRHTSGQSMAGQLGRSECRVERVLRVCCQTSPPHLNSAAERGGWLSGPG